MHIVVRILSLVLGMSAAKAVSAVLLPEVIREGGGGLDVIVLSTLVFALIAIPGMFWAQRIKARKAADPALQ